MTQAPLPSSSAPVHRSIFTDRQLTQFLMLVTVGLSATFFWYVASWMGVPREPHFRGSLLQPPVALVGAVLALVALAAVAFLADLLVGSRWFMAGLLAATSGLASWSIRGGISTYVLLRADSTGSGRTVFIQLLIEHLILMAGVSGLWIWLWGKRSADRAAHFATIGKSEDQGRTTPIAIAAQTGAMVLILLVFLAETAAKKQVLVSVFVASIISTAIAESSFGNRESAKFYWAGPLLAGLLGYAWAFMQPTGLETGFLRGALAALSRPLPLDFASAGCAGALLGYWMYMPEPLMGDSPETQPDLPAVKA